MAFALDTTTIPNNVVEKIKSMLYMKPRALFSKFKKGDDPVPIEFYIRKGNILHIPYLFASAFFNFIPNIDIPYPPVSINFLGALRENQIPVEWECWQLLQRYGTAILGLYPGFGKTILGAKACSRFGLVTAVLVHREILTTQWKKTFEDFTDAKVWIVGEEMPKEINVIICMNTRWSKIDLMIRNAVGFLIIDEAHAFCTPSNVPCLLEAFHPKYLLIESAYLMRDDEMECMIYAMAGERGVYRESNKPFKVMKICTGTKPERKMNYLGNVDYMALVRDVSQNFRRNEIILSLIASNLKYKILVLTLLREHSELLYNSLQNMKISSDYLCGGKKGYQDSNVLIGTISKIGTGFDPATSCPTYQGLPFQLLILVCSIKKYAAYVQNIGRVFRADFPIVMHLVDGDNIHENHWKIGKRWYLARGGIITEHHIPGGDIVTNPTNINTVQNNWVQEKANQLRLAKEAAIARPVVLHK